MIARRVGAGVTLVLALIGLLICLAAIAGIWAVRRPVDRTADAGIATLIGYLDFITEDIHQVNADLADTQTAVNDVAQQAQQGQVDPTAAANLTEHLERLGELVGQLQSGFETFGGAVIAVDQLPGVHADRLETHLQSVTDGLMRVQSSVADVQSAIAQRDNPRIVTLATNLSSALAGTRTALADVQTNIDTTRAAFAHAQVWIPRWTLIGALAVTLLFALFGAGQISLIARAGRRLRKRRKTTMGGTPLSSRRVSEKPLTQPAARDRTVAGQV